VQLPEKRKKSKFHLIYFNNGEVSLFSFDNLEDVKSFCTVVYKKIKEDPLGEFKLFCFYGNFFKFKMNPFRLCLDDREEIIYEENEDESPGSLGLSINEILNKYSSSSNDLNDRLLSEEVNEDDLLN